MRAALRCVLAALLCAGAMPATSTAADAGTPTLSGTARVDSSAATSATPQRGGRFALAATLSPAGAPVTAPAALIGGAYTLQALATTNSLVCYDDTIFRNDFDGDGF